MGLFIHCREEGWLFEALFDLGSSGLRCRGCKSWCREKRRRSWFWNRSTSWEPQGSRRPSLSHLLTWNFAIFSQYFLQYWPGILQYFCNIDLEFFCRGINIFHHRRMAAAVFVFDLTLKSLELEKLLQSRFYFWLILENRRIERAAIKDE